MTFLSAFAWLIKGATMNDQILGKKIDNILIEWSSFPDKFSETVKYIQELPETFLVTPPKFIPINKLEDDLFALFTYSKSSNARTVELRNLQSDSSIHTWEIDGFDNSHRRIIHPLLYPDQSIVYASIGVPGIFRINKDSEKIWDQPKIISHHSLNRDNNNNIWLCTYPTLNIKEPKYDAQVIIDGRKVGFIDNAITCLDFDNGSIVFHRSLSRILKDNNLENILLKASKSSDPLHINDIQPVLKSSYYFQKGDLFISCKNISTIFHYRPLGNKIINIIEGPFQSQHDIDIINDSTISIFNNNTHTKWQNEATEWTKTSSPLRLGPFYSEIVLYHLDDHSFSTEQKNSMEANEIYTFTEGLSEKLGDETFFIEEQNSGLLWVLKNDEVIYKNVLKSQYEGHHHLPNWTRIIKN
ncbi:MAG: Uncharacterised protein [Owenweeksia sp. TMED14]|nr:MAG: Uncharacterised protein [Owenweeksia sp. TMED14]|tara:strand:- start:7872 stop:9110 length:1239 start_codon:yes stop_codon:yes gene_type:complete